MRFFFRRCIPPFNRMLLVESGPREVARKALLSLRCNHGDGLAVDLLTCYAGVPEGFENAVVYRTSDYQGRAGRSRLYAELRARGYGAMGVICSGDPIMTKWKWAVAAKLPAKLLIVNENADYFWFDRGNWRIIGYFALFRAGLVGPGSLGVVARVLLFPLTMLYLLGYAAAVHVRRLFYGFFRGMGRTAFTRER